MILVTRFCFAGKTAPGSDSPAGEHTMTCPSLNYLTSFFKRSIPVGLTILFLLVPALAEPLLFLNNRGKEFKIPEVVRLNVKRHPVAGLNDKGDLIIRCGDVSLTVAYNPFTDIIEPQKRTSISQKEDSPSMSGISLRVAFAF
ncbi:MAG: hypothetical protein A2079_00490 [Geobacteraceae bacterium GWC2_48_7]|nr:MAG: hypothetical protein A2079_00490 [Geobacteraceae bacterium GWC2_48_7]